MGSAEKPPGTPQAEEAPPVETPADGSLPPVTPPKEQSGAEAADDELSMRQPGFTSPLIKMGARTVEKLERVGVELPRAGREPVPDESVAHRQYHRVLQALEQQESESEQT